MASVLTSSGPTVEYSSSQNSVQAVAVPTMLSWCLASNLSLPTPTVTPLSYLNQAAVGVGQQEKSPPVMASANLSRREHSRCNAVAQAFEASGDLAESQSKMAKDVFGEHPAGPDLSDDSGHIRPEVPGVGLAELFAREAERLARVARSEDIHDATPRAAAEGAHIRPDRRLIQGLVIHPGHESGRSICVPLDHTNSAVSGLCDVQAEFQASGPGAETEAVQRGR